MRLYSFPCTPIVVQSLPIYIYIYIYIYIKGLCVCISAIKYWRLNNAEELGTIRVPHRVTGKLLIEQRATVL